MGSRNVGGGFPWPLVPGSTIAGYDDLPKDMRDALKSAHYNVNLATIHGYSAESLSRTFTKQIGEMALKTYGPDHPQAQ